MAMDRTGQGAGTDRPLGTVIIEAGQALPDLEHKLEAAMIGAADGRHRS